MMPGMMGERPMGGGSDQDDALLQAIMGQMSGGPQGPPMGPGGAGQMDIMQLLQLLEAMGQGQGGQAQLDPMSMMAGGTPPMGAGY